MSMILTSDVYRLNMALISLVLESDKKMSTY